MQIQKIGALDTHNITLTTFLPSNQIKHLAYIRLDAPKFILHNNTELRLVTGLVATTINTIKIYAVYERTVALDLGSWRLHQDIVGMVGWDKIIIVYASNKVIGLRFQGGRLKNSFLVSLQFLPIDEQDVCRVYADRLGYYFVIHIKNYLVLCFSQTLANKYKARVVQKQKVYMVEKDAKWNENNHNHILDMVQIKLFEHQLSKIQQLQLIDQTIYFMGHRGKQSQLYYIHVFFFFTHMESSKSITSVPNHDQPPPNTQVIVSHPHPRTATTRDPQFLYYNGVSPSIILKSQQTTYEVAVFQTNCRIFCQGNSMFPILVWQLQKSAFYLIEKQRTFHQTYEFKIKQVITNFCTEVVAYREGLIAFASRTELLLICSSGEREVLHRSLGSIIDFHVGKDMLFIENYDKKLTRLYEISRGPRIDPRPFVTHKRKRFLQTLPDLHTIYSLVLGKQSIQILAVRRGSGQSKSYNFYREGATQFDPILQEALDYLEANIAGEPVLILRTKEGLRKIIRFSDKQPTVQQFNWEGWKMQKRWSISEYLIGWSGKTWSFLNLNTRQQKTFELPVQREAEQFLSSFLQFRKLNIDKSLKDHPLVNLLEVWLLDLFTGNKSLIYASKNISEGSPILSNQLLTPGSFQTDKFRSITCPDYSLNDYDVHFVNSQQKSVLACLVYQWQNKHLVLLVTSDQQLLIYRKYFNIDDGSFLLARINTPLNVVKTFKWNNEKSFVDLGQGVLRVGNFLLYKGELLQSITGRSLFKMQGSLWALVSEGKIRLVQLGNDVIQGFSIRQIQCGLKQEMMGIDSTSHYYCVYSRKGFQIFTKEFVSHWRAVLGNQTIVSFKMFEHYVGMSYYDYYCDEQGVNDYQSVRFRFRIYNCTTKTKIVQRQKPLDEPILHIRFIVPDKLLLVTSSLIFINVLKNQKTLELFRTHNFSSKRSFLSTFSYIPDIVSTNPGSQSSPGYMLFGGSHGGLGFFVGKWLEEDKLKEQWFEPFRCGIREVSFLQFGEQKEELKALLADQDGNLIVLNLKKDHAQKLADFRLGAMVNSFKSKSGQDRVKYCAMNDGSIKLLTAVKLDNPEVSYLDFQSYFCNQLPFHGGFNLRVSRQLSQKYRSGRLVSKGNVVDGDILQSFFSLTGTLQQHIVRESEMQISALKGILPF